MNIYLNEYNLLMGSGGVSYLPFVSGILRAYAETVPIIKESFKFMPFVYNMDSPNSILAQYTKRPDIATFSISMWNEKLSLHIAQEIKKRWPTCLIIFGGSQCPHKPIEYLKKYDFIDLAIRAEGEEAFKELLLRYLESKHDFSNIPNLSYRNDKTRDCIINLETPETEKDLDKYPSPYLNELYEYLFDKKNHNYQIIIETNRGCPFLCTFCYWGRGGNTNKYRFHSLDRVRDEIEWAGQHKIPYIFNADSNFGMHRRDMEIAKYLADAKQRYGYPEKFRTCWGKNTDEKIFNVANYLFKNDLGKGMTLGRQSNDKTVLKNIKRDNIKLDTYKILQRRFNRLNVPIYAEMILGLPGETYDTWISGVEELLQTGLNNQLFIYPAEVYPNTELGEPEYQKNFGIQTQRIELREIHCSPRETNWISEYQDIVVKSNSMSISDWKKMTVFSLVTMLMHSMKTGYFVMAYLYKQHKLPYTQLLKFLTDLKINDSAGKIIKAEIQEFYNYTEGLLQGAGRGILMPEFGDIFWDVEEASFLRISEHLDNFYEEFEEVVSEFLNFNNKSFEKMELNEVMLYQRMRIPSAHLMKKRNHIFSYNIPEYFAYLFTPKPRMLIKKNQELIVSQNNYNGEKIKFAREKLLWGRKSGKILVNIDPKTDFNVSDVCIDAKTGDSVKHKLFDKINKFEKYKSL